VPRPSHRARSSVLIALVLSLALPALATRRKHEADGHDGGVREPRGELRHGARQGQPRRGRDDVPVPVRPDDALRHHRAPSRWRATARRRSPSREPRRPSRRRRSTTTGSSHTTATARSTAPTAPSRRRTSRFGLTLAATSNPVPFGRSTTIVGTLSGTGNGGRQVVLQQNPFPYTGGFTTVGNAQLTARRRRVRLRAAVGAAEHAVPRRAAGEARRPEPDRRRRRRGARQHPGHAPARAHGQEGALLRTRDPRPGRAH